MSNYHVFTGTNTISKIRESEHPFDTILVEYKVSETDNKRYYPINVSEIKVKNEPNFYWEVPDILAVKVKLPKDAFINSVEKFFKAVPNNKDPEVIVAYGFPSATASLTGVTFGVFDRIAIHNTFPAIINTGDTIQINNSYRVLNEMKPGMSGSPVFLKYVNLDYIFGGVLTSHGPNQTIIVKPQEVINLIHKLR